MLKYLAIAACLLGAPLNAATFELDPGHTEVRFIWSHGDVSRQSGKWADVSGTIEFDRERPAQTSARVTIKSNSAITGAAQLDEYLNSSSFFKPKSNPEITFISNGFSATSDTTGLMTGKLTINGRAADVTLDVTLRHEGEHPLGAQINYFTGNWLGITATAQVKRSTWGLDFLAPLLSDEIDIEINAEMREGGW